MKIPYALIVKTPAQLNTTSTAGGIYMKMPLHAPPTPPPPKGAVLQIYSDKQAV